MPRLRSTRRPVSHSWRRCRKTQASVIGAAWCASLRVSPGERCGDIDFWKPLPRYVVAGRMMIQRCSDSWSWHGRCLDLARAGELCPRTTPGGRRGGGGTPLLGRVVGGEGGFQRGGVVCACMPQFLSEPLSGVSQLQQACLFRPEVFAPRPLRQRDRFGSDAEQRGGLVERVAVGEFDRT